VTDWRTAHRRRVEELEAEATDVILDALAPILVGVAARFATVASVTAAADEAEARASLDDLGSIGVQWQAAVHDEVLPWFATVYRAGGDAAVEQVLGLGIAVLDVPEELMDARARDYLAGVENRFYPLSDEVWTSARAELVAGFEAGEGIDDLRRRITGVTELSVARAEALARTEVIAASNMGAQARVDLMGDAAPPYRQWLATMDGRTRPTHRHADGQVVERGQPFVVGGASLMVPGDPGGPAAEVMNCRCTVLFTDQAAPLLVAGRQQGGIVDEVEESLAAAGYVPGRFFAGRTVWLGGGVLAAAAVMGPPQVDSTTGEPHTGAMVGLVPAAEDADRLVLLDGEPVEALHLTLGYLGDGDEIPDEAFDAMLEEAEVVAGQLGPITAKVFGAAVWNVTGPEPCLVLNVGDDPDNDSRELLVAHMAATQIGIVGQAAAPGWEPPTNHRPWVAHVALAYNPPAGSLMAVAGASEGPITFDRLRLTRGSTAYDFTMGGSPPEEDNDMDRAELTAAIGEALARGAAAAGGAPITLNLTLNAAIDDDPPPPGPTGHPADPTSADADGPPAQPGEHLRAVMHRQGEATGLRDSGRVFTNMTYRDPPFAYHVQQHSSAHGGTPKVVPVGLVTRIVQTDGADYGFVRLDLENPDAAEHARRAVAGFDRWVSIGGDETAPKVTLVWPAPGEAADPMAVDPVEPDPNAPIEETLIEPEKVILDGVNVAELTAVSTPAQADATLEPTAELVAMFGGQQPELTEEDVAMVASAVDAGRITAEAAAVALLPPPTPVPMAPVGGFLDPAVARRLLVGDLGPELLTPLAPGCGCGGTCGGCDHGRETFTSDVTPAAALVAAASTVAVTDLPPAAWFQEPLDVELTSALAITDEGRIYGLLAPFGTNHRAYAKAGQHRTAPRRNVDYARFMGKWAVTREGHVPAGPITMGCGHASMHRTDHHQAVEHYDNSCSVFGMIAVGESDRLGGVWMAGAVLPGTRPETVARALACTCSGDWQSHPDRAGWQELVAALLVPVPGFAMAHASTTYDGDAMVASSVPVVHVATAAAAEARRRARSIASLAAAVGRTPAARVLDARKRVL